MKFLMPLVGQVLAVLLVGFPAAGQEKIEAITRPSEDRVLSFVRAGRIAEVLVREGDHVKKGDELVRQDDEAERAQIAQLEAQARDDTRVKAAAAQLAQRRVELKQKEWARQQGAATELEVEQARLDVTISELSLKLTEFEHAQDGRKLKEALVQLDRMRLRSPIDGVVEQVMVDPGESADALEKVIRVVKIDPLWIDVPVPLERARKLDKRKDAAEVEFPGETGEPLRRTGRIIHIAAVADAASETLTVRVEVDNPSGRQAGERVYVSFVPLRPPGASSGASAAASPAPPAVSKRR
ncbi:MAG: efflux RND transporter periplasmic adaptor subunit [Planctomycetes bacterium]|nr:efflux RND transporter periplasmic adaptor subunit [Planctomycetota bacterium]